MSEQLFTLEQAKAELIRLECEETGHQWDVTDLRTIENPAGTPVEVVCTRCTQHHAVVADPAVDAPALPPVE